MLSKEVKVREGQIVVPNDLVWALAISVASAMSASSATNTDAAPVKAPHYRHQHLYHSTVSTSQSPNRP